MLSQLIERFVKRLCGRWLRGFDGSQVNVSLGGTVTLEDLDRLQQLGAGATSRVYLAQHRTTGERYARRVQRTVPDTESSPLR